MAICEANINAHARQCQPIELCNCKRLNRNIQDWQTDLVEHCSCPIQHYESLLQFECCGHDGTNLSQAWELLL